jgi:acetyl-CoA carboxylase carboxyl transferase subunit beta
MGFFKKPKYTTPKQKKRDIPAGLWRKCPGCDGVLFQQALEDSLHVCPHCGYHFPISFKDRLASLADPDTWEERFSEFESIDALQFTGAAPYPDKLAYNQKKTGMRDAIITGVCRIDGRATALGIMDFSFLGASMGSVVGERITCLAEYALEKELPLVLICASGGARMYEGMLSLMQMAKTSGALSRMRESRLPYIAVLTHPTMAGVMASFASLGDVILAEPGALIGFAGERVIRETTHEELPAGFQTAEFLLEHGLIDQIVPRSELKPRLSSFLDLLGGFTSSLPEADQSRGEASDSPSKGSDHSTSGAAASSSA